MAKKTTSNEKSPPLGMPNAARPGPKHPVAIPKKPWVTKKVSRREKLLQDRARKWEAVEAELTPAEREQLRGAVEEPAHEWFLVEVPDGDFPEIHTFAEIEGLVDKLKAIVEIGRSRVFPFYGTRLQISIGPLRHLLLPEGDPIPLFDLPEALLPDETGFVGQPEDEPAGLTSESPRAEAVAAEEGDDGLDQVEPGWQADDVEQLDDADEASPGEDDGLADPEPS